MEQIKQIESQIIRLIIISCEEIIFPSPFMGEG